MNFSEALELLKQGKRIRRGYWFNETFIYLVNGSTFKVNKEPLISHFPADTIITYSPHIDMHLDDKRVLGMSGVDTVDILAEDWEMMG